LRRAARTNSRPGKEKPAEARQRPERPVIGAFEVIRLERQRAMPKTSTKRKKKTPVTQARDAAYAAEGRRKPPHHGVTLRLAFTGSSPSGAALNGRIAAAGFEARWRGFALRQRCRWPAIRPATRRPMPRARPME